MSLLITIMAGILFAAGVYCLLRRNMTKIIIGIILLSQAANLLVFTMGSITAHKPVFADSETGAVAAGHADPIPQALVLTAIVIGFGLMVFTITLLMRAHALLNRDYLNQFNHTDALP
jgi:multicomponent Na+:H+ antiporter subunit C